jgi:hypothetical protein
MRKAVLDVIRNSEYDNTSAQEFSIPKDCDRCFFVAFDPYSGAKALPPTNHTHSPTPCSLSTGLRPRSLGQRTKGTLLSVTVGALSIQTTWDRLGGCS